MNNLTQGLLMIMGNFTRQIGFRGTYSQAVRSKVAVVGPDKNTWDNTSLWGWNPRLLIRYFFITRAFLWDSAGMK